MITTFTMKSFNAYATRLNIMKTSHNIFQHFFMYTVSLEVMNNLCETRSITRWNFEFT